MFIFISFNTFVLPISIYETAPVCLEMLAFNNSNNYFFTLMAISFYCLYIAILFPRHTVHQF